MTLRLYVASAALVLAACGSGRTTPPGSGLTLLVAQTPEAAGTTCPHGGVTVSAGLDTDHDGVLDPEEVAKTEPVCDAGPAPAVLTRTAAEAPGERCAAGGTRIDAGRDANGDGALGDAEVEQTAYACAPDASPVLARVDPEPYGSSCPAGGSAVRFGPDADGSGALDDAEVAGTRYVCETKAAPGFTVRSKADADLVSAASVVEGYLEIRVEEAIDLDLSPGVVTHGITVRSPALTGLGLYCRTVGDDVVVEDNPHLKRFWLGAVAALGGDVVVRNNPELEDVSLPSGSGLAGDQPFRYPGHVVVSGNPRLLVFALRDPTEVAGDLRVEGNRALRSLMLEGLRRVGGDLVVADDDALEEFPPIFAIPLTSVGGVLDVRDNANLLRFELGALRTAGGVRVARNTVLQLAELPALVAVLGAVSVEDNPEITYSWRPAATSPLRVVTGSFSVQRNPRIGSLAEFGNVSSIGGTLLLAGNERLRDVGFDGLVEAGAVQVVDNPALWHVGPTPAGADAFTSPPSLTRLASVVDLVVDRNATLRHLVLPSLRSVSGVLGVEDNPALPTCQADGLPGTYRHVSGNDDVATCP